MFTILWDNDGVLVETEGLYYQACRSVLAEVGIELSPGQFKEISLRRGESVFALAAARGIADEEIARLRRERDRRYAALLEAQPCAIDGAEEVLRSLHGRFRMGVVTSSRRTHFEIAHARSGLTGYLDFVVANEDYERSKPYPDAYLTALARNGLTAAECIAVEDSQRGLTAAVAAGLSCLVVRSAWAGEGDFRLARRVLGSIREVPEEVIRWAAE